jgi:hypothetical protein
VAWQGCARVAPSYHVAGSVFVVDSSGGHITQGLQKTCDQEYDSVAIVPLCSMERLSPKKVLGDLPCSDMRAGLEPNIPQGT